MSRSINRTITSLVIIWIVVLIFQKEILSFIGGWGPSFIKNILLQVVGFLIYVGDWVWNLIKLALKWLVDRVAQVVSGADPLYGLVKGLTDLLTNIIKGILDILSPIFGKVITK